MLGYISFQEMMTILVGDLTLFAGDRWCVVFE